MALLLSIMAVGKSGNLRDEFPDKTGVVGVFKAVINVLVSVAHESNTTHSDGGSKGPYWAMGLTIYKCIQ